MRLYLGDELGDPEMAALVPSSMESTARFNAQETRRFLRERGFRAAGQPRYAFRPWQILRFAYRPFDTRWVYWEPETKLLDEKRFEYVSETMIPGVCLATQQKSRSESSPPQVISSLGCLDLLDRGSSCFPATSFLSYDSVLSGEGLRANLSSLAVAYLSGLGLQGTVLFYHSLAVMHTPRYRVENAGALLGDWPRIPLPGERCSGPEVAAEKPRNSGEIDEKHTSGPQGRPVSIAFTPGINPRPTLEAGFSAPCRAPDDLVGVFGTAEAEPFHKAGAAAGVGESDSGPRPAVLLARSAELGRRLAELLDAESSVRPGAEWSFLAALKLPLNVDLEEALKVTAGWGSRGQGSTVMPGRGRLVARDWTDVERGKLGALAAGQSLNMDEALGLLGEGCVDISLNGTALWAAVPMNVWEYTLGGYQVLKKWLSYREAALLGRPLHEEEVRYFSQVVRRITAILLMGPALDASYQAILPGAAGLNPA